jgi:hypothetical protein
VLQKTKLFKLDVILKWCTFVTKCETYIIVLTFEKLASWLSSYASISVLAASYAND